VQPSDKIGKNLNPQPRLAAIGLGLVKTNQDKPCNIISRYKIIKQEKKIFSIVLRPFLAVLIQRYNIPVRPVMSRGFLLTFPKF